MDTTSFDPSSHLHTQRTVGLWHGSLKAIFYVFHEGLDVIILRTSSKHGNMPFQGGKVSLERCLVFKTRMVRSRRLGLCGLVVGEGRSHFGSRSL